MKLNHINYMNSQAIRQKTCHNYNIIQSVETTEDIHLTIIINQIKLLTKLEHNNYS